MAQAQQKKSGSSGSTSRSSSKSSNGNSKSAAAKSSAKRTATKAASKSRSQAKRKAPQSSNGDGPLSTASEAVTSGAKGAAETIGSVASKAKTGLLAGGAAAAGLAATAVITKRSRSKPKVLGVSLPKRNGSMLSKAAKSIPTPKRSSGIRGGTQKVASKVTEAANRADKAGQRVSSVASSVRQVSQTANDAAKKA